MARIGADRGQRRQQRADRAAALGRALWYGEVGNLIGTVAALAWSHDAFIIGSIVTAIFAIVGSKTRRNPR